MVKIHGRRIRGNGYKSWRNFKPKMSEGGIIAGVKSGPAPKSGPTPHGLPYVAKNVRPIKERK